MRRLAVCWLFAVAALGGGADSPAVDKSARGEPRARPVTDYASLAASLRAAGASVTQDANRVEQPFFPVSGRVIKVHGEDVQVFQFASAERAAAQASQVSPNGSSVGTTKIHWIAPPHFYRSDKLLVLYLGSDQRVLKALEAALGRQFAGQ